MPVIPFALQWQIAENQLLPLKNSVNGRLKSTKVTIIPEFEYYMKIQPKKHRDGCGLTFIFLHLNFKNVKKVEIDCTFTVESANYSETFDDIYDESMGCGPFVCKTEELFDSEKKFFVDGNFTLKVNGIFKFENEGAIPAVIEQKWEGGELGDEFWMKDDTKDLTINIADGKEIKVHKYVLDVRSDAILNSNMSEANENKVTIPNFSYTVVETALKIIYNCSFTSKLSMDELMQLQQFFDKYLLQTLKAKVEPYLIAQISATTVVRLTNYSLQTKFPKLKEKCMEFLLISVKQQTALADIEILDKDIALKILQNSLYRIL